MPEKIPEFRIVVHQTGPVLGEMETNEREMRRRMEGCRGAHLQVFPELSLTGYTLRNGVQRCAMSLEASPPLVLPIDSSPMAYGIPERGKDELVYNTALIQHGGRVLAKHRKVYLPTYGTFDEGRYFARGSMGPPVVELPSGWRIGLLVCEDFWHPALLYLAAMQGADVILVLSAAPGRGTPKARSETAGSGKATSEARFSSPETWTLLARTAALQYGVFLVLANRVGVEEGLTFAGGSVVVAPSGEVLAEAPQGEPGLLDLTLSRQELRSSRTPFAHLRDEDPGLLARNLEFLLRIGAEDP